MTKILGLGEIVKRLEYMNMYVGDICFGAC